MPARYALFLILAASLLGACGRGGVPATGGANGAAGQPAVPTGAGHAAADVVPGSYEDWCEEHQVPETQCTRCDPSLIPAFQAVGDWDADHGLPMSQCTVHDPNLKIVRPPKPEGQ